MPYTGEICAGYLPWLEDKLAKMNKRAAKLAVPPMALNVLLGKVTYKVNAYNRTYAIASRRLEVELTGEVVKLAGWKLTGIIEHLAGGDVLLGEVPEAFRNRGPVCDHCQGKRARTMTCILQHEDGRQVQIGRSCIQDFLGADPQRLLWWAHFEKKLAAGTLAPEEGYCYSPRAKLTVTEYITACAVSVRLNGWHKAGAASPTSWAAFSLINRWNGGAPKTNPLREEELPTAEDSKRAAAALNWITALPENESSRNSYLMNLQAIIRTGTMDSRRCYGIAASLLVAHQNYLNRKLQPGPTVAPANAAPAAPASEWVGIEGQRQEFELTCIAKKDIESEWGGCTLCMFVDDKGNKFKWFASGKTGFAQGDKVKLRATVKAHDEYKGQKQTSLTRCTLLAKQEAAAAA